MTTARVREFRRTGRWPERERPLLDTRAVRRDLRSGVLTEDQKRAAATIDALLRENAELRTENESIRDAFRAICEATNHDGPVTVENHDCGAAMMDDECSICGVPRSGRAADVGGKPPLPHYGVTR